MSDVKTFMFPDSGTRSGGLDPNALLAMSAEVESMRRASQSILDSMEHNQQVVGRCGECLALINPQIAKEREQEQKIQNLEKEMNGMRTDLSDIKGLLLSMSEANKK